jgi:hypothetical protein
MIFTISESHILDKDNNALSLNCYVQFCEVDTVQDCLSGMSGT